MPSALVVEDEAVTSLELVSLLESWGYEAVSVKTGEDAIETAIRMKPDVILMDIVLPSDIDGVTAAGAIKGEDGRTTDFHHSLLQPGYL